MAKVRLIFRGRQILEDGAIFTAVEALIADFPADVAAVRRRT